MSPISRSLGIFLLIASLTGSSAPFAHAAPLNSFKENIRQKVQCLLPITFRHPLMPPSSASHILFGHMDRIRGGWVGGHSWPSGTGKKSFPVLWSNDKILKTIVDIAESPNAHWQPTHPAANGQPRFKTEASVPTLIGSVLIRVIYQPGLGVVSAYPVK